MGKQERLSELGTQVNRLEEAVRRAPDDPELKQKMEEALHEVELGLPPATSNEVLHSRVTIQTGFKPQKFPP